MAAGELSSSGIHDQLDIDVDDHEEDVDEEEEDMDEHLIDAEEEEAEDDDETILSNIDEDEDLLNTTTSTKSTASRTIKSPTSLVDYDLKSTKTGLAKNKKSLVKQQRGPNKLKVDPSSLNQLASSMLHKHLNGTQQQQQQRTPLYDFTLQALEMSLYGYLRQTDPLYVGHAISGIRMSPNNNNNNTSSLNAPSTFSHSPQDHRSSSLTHRGKLTKK